MDRSTVSQAVSLTDSAATTPVIKKGGFRHGCVFVPLGSTITTLTILAAPHAVPSPSLGSVEPGDFLPLFDMAADTPAAIVLAVEDNGAFRLPEDISAVPFLKFVADASGDVVVTFSS